MRWSLFRKLFRRQKRRESPYAGMKKILIAQEMFIAEYLWDQLPPDEFLDTLNFLETLITRLELMEANFCKMFIKGLQKISERNKT